MSNMAVRGRRQLSLLAGISLAALATGASAADLRMPVKAPPPAAVALSWAGFYIGGNAGAIWHHWAFTDTDDLLLFGTTNSPFWSGTRAAVMAGGQVGYNWQSGVYVFGLEADFDWTGAKSNLSFVRGVGNEVAFASTKMQWLSTVRV